eukprot:4887716-Lingulodinium_polyedra.AAC.1
MVGGTWHPQRCYRAGFADRPERRLCGRLDAGLTHRWWQCEVLQHARAALANQPQHIGRAAGFQPP